MKNANTKITCYTDGSSRGNPGPGGWGAIVVLGGTVVELAGFDKKTTNNRMELSAVIGALRKVGKTDASIEIYTDSTYVVKGITNWIHNWKEGGWKTKAKGDVLNKDLWQELDEVVSGKKISWFVVKGHAGIPANERVDEIATAFADGESVKLFDGSLRDYGIKVAPPTKEQIENAKSAGRRDAKAYSYLSLVDGVFKKHSAWAECEKEVKGKAGAKFRKAISKEDEEKIIREWGI